MPVRDDHYLFRTDGLLGTAIELSVFGAESPPAAEQVAEFSFTEIERLQGVFDVFDDSSELNRWQRGETAPGPELNEVIALAMEWRERSGRAFDPGVEVLMTLWNLAGSTGRPPGDAEIERTIAEMRGSGTAGWNLNGIAKGWIIDRAAWRAFRLGGVKGLMVNGGGDLLTLGADPVIAGIEDPRRPFDNVPPVSRVAVHDAALATSGTLRRGWSIDGVWYGHVVDPRTGYPVGHVESASVIAGDAATADVIATILTVLPVGDGLDFAARAGVACRITGADRSVHRNDLWRVAEEAAMVEVQAHSQPPLSGRSGSLRTVAANH